MKETMSAQEVADYLGVSRPTIYKWANYAKLPSRQINGRVRLFNRSQVDEWVREKEEANNG
ncbi:TPA: helix-turn-helix domain-containing protein [Listeria monocytogenes]|uniref:helix-turn-helix domain-containing protein n=1 Tax=Listeria TaxID=1637 RepID=UPI0004F2FFE0|nr:MULTISPECIES: helix-turn-helix domain-containing protein [Listeria]EAD2808760.1 AlpA family phage regulatory protein [Listeria monocytogenes]EAE5681893.1 DNA-binding protein [Listeria monocytogenes]EAE6958642.1 DNA-binding protein [Listeria monocytogenes]EAE9815972.1 DNA-binding protein [Listeria monocytogenes]EAF4600094.1 DNA-binding protein [Listeria monocytogenes]